ncbi:flagellar FlbD family protein [Agromyces sp. NPDC056379]|uniref:flagellar FlbD family protein n=1 Tax=unclassified Agromyces TaxID=2639701 RepID=UPI0035D78AC3
MIVLTRLNGTRFALNTDLVERIHANPDTTLLMVDGTNYIVTETIDEVIAAVVEFRARVLARTEELTGEPRPRDVIPLARTPKGR